ncbi:NADH dehydrogenase [ubiquinone] 1 beta subcomplex subunit 2 [Olea europaea subsp. europaea]|uniref:NADH dehydrogenase [ubiquinone] 1 beta subcomplex subunit 2 n=1 Tax=Olea europaea subsp. europaea TaxID=158383 RepID=A0A8S0QCZ9_OLEEU|nr:NADH dehydrogenase [ubiquinone] 1 beta subcomplex subunit 2 [Olea europaea subsp. europaea]
MAGGHGHGFTYKGVTLHQPKRWHTVTGKGLCAVMWVGGILGMVMMITIRFPAKYNKEHKAEAPICSWYECHLRISVWFLYNKLMVKKSVSKMM